MSGTIWSKFFWSDWLSDIGLRRCGVLARGVWMDMLCVAAQNEPFGYVGSNGEAWGSTDISRISGISVAEATAALAELERNGVFSRTRDGTIYNRRMVYQEKRTKHLQKIGKLGGNPSLSKQKGISPMDNHAVIQEVNLLDKPNGRIHKPEAKSITQFLSASEQPKPRLPPVVDEGLEDIRGKIIQACDHANIPIERRPDTGYVYELSKLGCTPKEIVDLFKAKLAEGKTIYSLKYLEDQLKTIVDNRERLASLPAPPPMDWSGLCQVYVDSQGWSWPAPRVPKPGDPRCPIPTAVLVAHGIDPVTGKVLAKLVADAPEAA